MTALTNTQFVDQFIDVLTAQGVTLPNPAAAKAALLPVVSNWNDGSVSRAVLANRQTEFIDVQTTWQQQLLDWWTGTATGGPNSDGTYPFTDKLGVTTYQPCPAKLIADFGGGGGTSPPASLTLPQLIVLGVL